MRHFAPASFWKQYERLPQSVQKLADKNFGILKQQPNHPSLHLKRVGRYWSVRVGLRYRALAVERGEDLVWFWIGTHADYDRLVANS